MKKADKESQCQCAVSARELKKIWDTVPVGLYVTELQSGLFVKANPFCIKMLGYEHVDDLVGKIKSSDLYSKKRRAALKRALAKDKTVSDFEIELALPNGEKVWACATARLSEDGKNIEGSLTDITRRKLAEKELEETKEIHIKVLNEIQTEIDKKLRAMERISA